MDLVPLIANQNTPCTTCKYFGFCDKQTSCFVCEHCNKNGTCRCLELELSGVTVCPYYKKKEVEE